VVLTVGPGAGTVLLAAGSVEVGTTGTVGTDVATATFVGSGDGREASVAINVGVLAGTVGSVESCAATVMGPLCRQTIATTSIQAST
jgi:hypothetical protein